jgi:hypothetical protein
MPPIQSRISRQSNNSRNGRKNHEHLSKTGQKGKVQLENYFDPHPEIGSPNKVI